MTDDPAFLFYPGDYLRDTQCLSESVQVAYDRIICEHMRNICITQQQLNFFTKRLSDDQKKELMSVLTKIPGGFQIEWVAKSIEKRRKYSDSRRKNRSGKKNNISKSYVPHMENENENVIEDWNTWGTSILKKEDAGWEKMRGREITAEELKEFLSVAVRRNWKMETQQQFRVALNGFKSLSPDKSQAKTRYKLH